MSAGHLPDVRSDVNAWTNAGHERTSNATLAIFDRATLRSVQLIQVAAL